MSFDVISWFLIVDNHVKNKKYGNFVSISSLTGKCAAQKLKNFCSSSLWTCLHHMVILRSQNKITDFLMILARVWAFKETSETRLNKFKRDWMMSSEAWQPVFFRAIKYLFTARPSDNYLLNFFFNSWKCSLKIFISKIIQPLILSCNISVTAMFTALIPKLFPRVYV